MGWATNIGVSVMKFRTHFFDDRLADDRPMNRLSDSSLIPTSQFRVWSSYAHAVINSNVKYVWPIPVPITIILVAYKIRSGSKDTEVVVNEDKFWERQLKCLPETCPWLWIRPARWAVRRPAWNLPAADPCTIHPQTLYTATQPRNSDA